MKEIKDVAMWEETDSEIVKYHLQEAITRIQDLKEQINELFDEYLELKDRINKAIEYIEKALKDDYSEFMYMSEPKDILDILRGDENEKITN